MAETVVKLVPENAQMVYHVIKPQECVTMVANLGISSLAAMKVSLNIFVQLNRHFARRCKESRDGPHFGQ